MDSGIDSSSVQQGSDIIDAAQNNVEGGIATVQSNVAAAQDTIQSGLDLVQSKIALLKNSLSLIPKDAVPAVTFGMLAVAIFLVIVFFALCVFYINSKPPAIIKKKEKKESKPDETINKRVRHEDLPIISGRLGEILTLNGLIKAGPVTKTFFKIMEAIKSSTYDIRWRYKLPCFMMIGPEGAGKSTILASLNFEYLTADGSSMDFMWKLFKKAAIFEFPRLETSEDANKFWPFLAELFLFIRPRRPLDGIILTIPADMLLANTSNIQKQAQETFDRIFAFQREVNFRLPIYLLITKTDLVPGFAEMARMLEERTKQQIFGWSNPYTLNTAFSSAWIGEIFDTFNAGLRKATINLAKEKLHSRDLTDAILCGAQFDKIKKSLSLYLITMFQAHNPSDGLLLRGVYCICKQKEIAVSHDIIQPSALNPQLLSNIDICAGSSFNNALYFVNDLFKEKIFKESNLATPIKVEAIDMNAVSVKNKIIFAGGAVVASLGWFYGNCNIKEKIADYYHSLSGVKSMMIKVKFLEKHISSAEDQYDINRQISALLQGMPLIKRFDITSIFVPPSWFSNLQEEIMNTLGLVFDAVVVKAMYIDLNINVKEALKLPSPECDDSSRDIFDVNSFRTFQNLLNFSKKISAIKRLSSEYNEIRHLEDRKSVIDLTTTLFKGKFDISEEIKTRLPNRKLMPPQFYLESFQPKIEETLIALFDEFLQEVFSDSIGKILQAVADNINNLGAASKESSVAFTTQDLARVYQRTALINDILGNKNFAWIASDHFAPIPQYVNMMDALGSSDIISRQCVKKLVKDAELKFHKFKGALLQYKTDLTDNIFRENLTATSAGFDNLQKELKILLDLPFICVVPNVNFSNIVLEDKMLIWDVKKLKEISDLIDAYYGFSETLPKDMRPQYFENYKTIARKCLLVTLRSMLGCAELMEDMPLGKSRALLESAYKDQADNILSSTVVLAKLVKLLDEIYAADSVRDFGFSATIVSQYTNLLEKIDALFNMETPYSPGDAVFDGWRGDSTPKYLGIKDNMELKKYLAAQFERIQFLSKDLASPVVELLSTPHVQEKVKNRDLVFKWKEIIESVKDYEAKKPGNSLAGLEEFLTNTLNAVSLEAFDSQGEIKNFSEDDGDFFREKRSHVAKALISRADVVKYDKAATSYKKIGDLFNSSLRNKFPFANSDSEVLLADLEAFVALYEQNSANLQNVFEQNKDLRQINDDVFVFLNNMSKVVPLLRAWLNHSKSPDPQAASIVFNVILRPSPEAEALTSSVMDREMIVNSTTIHDNTNAVFFNGNETTVNFSWVASASTQPYKEEAKGNLSISGPRATFSYKGKWSLFRMIEQHKMNKDVEAPSGILLQFDVPSHSPGNGNSLLTTKIVLKVTPMQKEGDKTTPIAWPIFPATCPDLHKPQDLVDHFAVEPHLDDLPA